MLCRAGAVERHHFGHKVEVATLGLSYQTGKMPPVMDDVGVGEQYEFRRTRFGQALSDCPQLAAPAGRPGAPVQHGQPRIGAAARDGAGGVAAGVVHQDDPERSGIILRQQRAQRLTDDRRLVAGRHDDRDGRGSGGAPRRKLGARLPEPPMRRQQINPDQQRQHCQRGHVRSMPLARNQATASSIAWRAGRGA